MSYTSKLLGTIAFAGAALASTPASADQTFEAGSLIIPATSVYQTDCGAVSMYGLIYQILRANVYLDAHATYEPIEIYYSYNEAKASPNRCTPTNLHSRPTVSTTWADGCDFAVADATTSVTPVQRIDNLGVAADVNIVTRDTSSKSTVYPQYGAVTIRASTGYNTVRYWGGSFIIDSTDADTFIKLLAGQITATDNGVSINFAPFRQAGGCTFGTDWWTSTVGGYVNVHRAKVSFTAPVPKIFDEPPPRLALLALDKDVKTGQLSNGILQGYLSRAGLTFTGAYGCPVGSVHAGNTTTCPNGATPGEIFDTFDFADVLAGRLANMSGGTNTYKMFWAPHWEFKSDAGPTAEEADVVAQISTFLEGRRGLMAECASIDTFEGSPQMTASVNGKFQTCLDDGAGACTAAFEDEGLSINSGNGTTSSDPQNATLRNCSDVNMTTGSDCFYISYPGDPFVQFGDYRWINDNGNVADFLPNTGNGSIYRPGVLPLLSGVTSLDATKLTSPAVARASGILEGDYISRNTKDNDAAKGNILYLGGHDLTHSVAGTKVVLQTLLQLGTPTVIPVIKEISRATPIVALVGSGEALIQGTFESVTPAGTPKTMLLDSDAADFEFPFIKGHLRAFNAVGVSAATFDEQSFAFDAATMIPAADYAGCAPYSLACRTVFTNTTQNCSRSGTPCTNVVFSDSTVATVGPLMAADLTPTSQQVLVRRVLEGVPNEAAASGYVPRLGGIDRSTVAVIPQSLVAGTGARPTMIYVGGSDGMLHAICGNNVAPCTEGRELWAFMPRNQLSSARTNTTRIDGSPRVQDFYGDFTGTGFKSFRTVLMFQTASGDAAAAATAPATYAIDVSDPGAPTLLWEYTTPGRGLAITAGVVANKSVAFVQTNSGTLTPGTVVTAIDIETGLALWTTPLDYPAPRTVSTPIPETGIPGGAVAIDNGGGGNITDVVFTTLYGDIYQLNALTGANRHDPNPLFRFTQDLKPFGGAPAMFNNGVIVAVAASGGYTELDSATKPLWTSPTVMQHAVAVPMNIPAAAAPLNEASPELQFATELGLGQWSFSQAQVIGNQVFIVTDTTDVNAATYGTTGTSTGSVLELSQTNGAITDTAVIVGGAASVGRSSTNQVYAASADSAQVLGFTPDPSTSTGSINGGSPSKVTRRLWLRTL